MKFKKYDRVKIITNELSPHIHIGDTGTIMKIDYTDEHIPYRVYFDSLDIKNKFDPSKLFIIPTRWCREIDIELVETEEKKES